MKDLKSLAVLVLAVVGAVMIAVGVWAIAHERESDDAALTRAERRAAVAQSQRDAYRDALEQANANLAALVVQRDALAAQITEGGSTPVVANPSPTVVVAPSETPVTNPAGNTPPGQQKKCTLGVLGLCL